MIEAAAAQQPGGIQHQAASQILKLRATQARDVRTNPLGALPLLLACVCNTQDRIPGQLLLLIMRSREPRFAAGGAKFPLRGRADDA